MVGVFFFCNNPQLLGPSCRNILAPIYIHIITPTPSPPSTSKHSAPHPHPHPVPIPIHIHTLSPTPTPTPTPTLTHTPTLPHLHSLSFPLQSSLAELRGEVAEASHLSSSASAAMHELQAAPFHGGIGERVPASACALYLRLRAHCTCE